jgi:hypothetical protein
LPIMTNVIEGVKRRSQGLSCMHILGSRTVKRKLTRNGQRLNDEGPLQCSRRVLYLQVLLS